MIGLLCTSLLTQFIKNEEKLDISWYVYGHLALGLSE